MSLETATQKVKEKVSTSAGGLDSSVKFDLGEGVVYLDGTANPPEVSNENKDADCTISMEMDDFLSMMDGELNAMNAFMGGKMKIDGDMSVAMKLSSVFG